MEYNFNVELACKIGVEEAIIVRNIVHWVNHNKANNTNFFEGKYWTYNSVSAFTTLFPFWTSKQLRRIMESLYEKNVIMKGNFNKSSFDRTGWYTLTDDYNYLLVIYDLPKQANGDAEKGNTIPYIKPNRKQSSSKEEDKPVLLIADNALTDFITQFNKVRVASKPYKLTKKVEGQLRQRLHEKYSVKEIIGALQNAMKSQFHIGNKFNDLTPEFITRQDKLEKYINYVPNEADQAAGGEQKGTVINL